MMTKTYRVMMVYTYPEPHDIKVPDGVLIDYPEPLDEHEATPAEIDAAASPQMQEDAAVGKAVREELENPLKPAYSIDFQLNNVILWGNDSLKFLGEGITFIDALRAAKLLPPA